MLGFFCLSGREGDGVTKKGWGREEGAGQGDDEEA